MIRSRRDVTTVSHVGYPACVSDPEGVYLGAHKGEGSGGPYGSLEPSRLACGGNTEGRPWPIPPPSFRGLAHGESHQGTSPWELSLSTYV